VPYPEILTIVQIRQRKEIHECLHVAPKRTLPPLPRPPYVRSNRPPRQQTNRNETSESDSEDETGNDLDPADVREADGDAANDQAQPGIEGTEVRIAARLWGWQPQCTTLTGLETVRVSPKGERIAVAQWDKVLIYALDPGALCKEPWEHDTDDEDDGDEVDGSEAETASGSEDGSEDASTTSEMDANTAEAQQEPMSPTSDDADRSEASSDSSDRSSMSSCRRETISAGPSHFYPKNCRKHDEAFGYEVVELRPIVLKMDGGAIIKNMIWGVGRGGVEFHGTDGSYEWIEVDEESGAKSKRGNDMKEFTVCAKDVLDSRERLHGAAGSQAPAQHDHDYTSAMELDDGAMDDSSTIQRRSEHLPSTHPKPSRPGLMELDEPPAHPLHSDHNISTNDATNKSPRVHVVGAESTTIEPLDGTTDEQRAALNDAIFADDHAPSEAQKPRHRRRIGEDELIVLTDRGVQIWDLSVWGRGRRIRRTLEGDDVLQ
jgi:hypothetical protein